MKIKPTTVHSHQPSPISKKKGTNPRFKKVLKEVVKTVEKKVFYISYQRFNVKDNSHLPDLEAYKTPKLKKEKITIFPKVVDEADDDFSFLDFPQNTCKVDLNF